MRTVGCRANQADSAALERGLDGERFEAVDDLARADVVVVNTCCVTAEAERDCRKLVRRAEREAPAAAIVVTGCAVSAFPAFADRLGDGAGSRVEAAASLEALRTRLERIAATLEGGGAAEGREPRPEKRTRALLKVQSGCSHGCAYCIVPRARGVERSTPLAEVLEGAARFRDDGARELVITGVQLGAWGVDLPDRPRLAGLVAKVADAFAPGRVRLSSIEPWSVDAALLDVIAGHPRVCAHLHVPLQSGADRVLGLMGRGYGLRDFAAIAEAAHARIPDLALGTDVLCGFPTETEEEHRATLRAIEELGLTHVHAFPFSPRPGTRAAALGSAPGRVAAKARVRELRAKGEALELRFRTSQVGAEREAIVEASRGGVARGLTDNFLKVEIRGAVGRGDLVRIRIEELGRGACSRAILIS